MLPEPGWGERQIVTRMGLVGERSWNRPAPSALDGGSRLFAPEIYPTKSSLSAD
jgi:hypothetical protein